MGTPSLQENCPRLVNHSGFIIQKLTSSRSQSESASFPGTPGDSSRSSHISRSHPKLSSEAPICTPRNYSGPVALRGEELYSRDSKHTTHSRISLALLCPDSDTTGTKTGLQSLFHHSRRNVSPHLVG